MAKTGSSSIQERLWRSREELAARGIYYPPWRPFNHSYELSALFRAAGGSGFLYRQLSPISPADWEQELARLRQRWQAFLANDEPGTYLMSAESLEHFHTGELQALIDFVAGAYDRIDIIMYARHPRSAISSRFEQAVKQVRRSADPQKLLAAAKQQARFGMLRRLQSVEGVDAIIVRPFDRDHFPGGQLLHDFFTALELPTLDAEDVALQANTSLGRNAVAFLLRHNARFPLYTDEGPNPERGLSGRQELLFRLMRAVQDEPLALDIRFTEEEAGMVNDEIDFVNRFLPAGSAFSRVESSAEVTALPGPGDVSPDFFSDLVNALALELDRTLDDQQHLAAVLRQLRGKS